MDRPTVYTVGGVAKLLGVSAATVARWFDRGKLQGYRIPGRQDVRIPGENLQRWLTARRGPKAQKAVAAGAYSSGQAAKVAGVSVGVVKRAIAKNELLGYSIPASQDRRIPREQLLRFLRTEGIEVNGLTPEPQLCAARFRSALSAALGAEAPDPRASPEGGALRLDCALPQPPARLDLAALAKAFDVATETLLGQSAEGIALRLVGEMDTAPVVATVRWAT